MSLLSFKPRTDAAHRRNDPIAGIFWVTISMALLAGLAGVTPADGWGGADLFHAPELRTQLAFQCDLRGGASSLVLMRGGRKLVVPYTEGAEALSLQSAYDLRQDPRELEDQGRAPWAVELFEQQRDALQQSLRARFQAAQAAPSEEARRELRELGYGGD